MWGFVVGCYHVWLLKAPMMKSTTVKLEKIYQFNTILMFFTTEEEHVTSMA